MHGSVRGVLGNRHPYRDCFWEEKWTLSALSGILPVLFSHGQDRKRIRHHLSSRRAATCRWRGWRRKLSRDQQNPIGLGIQRERLGRLHRFHILLDHKAGWTLLLDHSQGSIALRAERFHCFLVECRSIRSGSD